MASAETRRLKLWQGRIETEVEIAAPGRRWFICTALGG